MRKFYTLSLGLLLSFAAACSDDGEIKPETIPTIELQRVLFATYDDGAGSYAAELNAGELTLHLKFARQYDGTAMESPVPQTGSYTTNASDDTYRVDGESWWKDAAGIHPLTDAQFALVATSNGCTLSGTFSTSTVETLKFRTSVDIRFEHSTSQSTTLTSASGIYESAETNGSYTLRFKKENTEVELTLYAAVSTIPNIVIPDGHYRLASGTATGTIATQGCGWKEGGIYHAATAATCQVFYDGGQYTASGILSAASGQQIRYTYRGIILFGDSANPFLYTQLGGSWTMTTDRWYIYDKPSKTWVYSDTGNTYTMSMIGIPKYSCMLSTGLFDSTFSMLFGVDAEGLFIPCNPGTNPVAQVVSGSGTFWLFATLYDPETGYFLVGDNYVPLELSEDLSQFEVIARTGEANDPDAGGKISINYNYFGLIGANIATGKYTMFSNWPFVRLPRFLRSDAANNASELGAPAAPRGNLPQIQDMAKGAVTLTEEQILQIIQIR